MAGESESLRDLIESRAATHGVAPRRLWKWVLDAIVQDIIVPIFPDEMSLDTEYDHGGGLLTWRRAIRRVLPTIDSYGPPRWMWTLMFDVVGFDRWLKNALKDQRIPVRPKRRAGPKLTAREKAKLYIEKYPSGIIPPGVTYKQIANELGVSERTVRRAYGRE
jgi:hypothetical protein